jgi:BolA-like protein 3
MILNALKTCVRQHAIFKANNTLSSSIVLRTSNINNCRLFSSESVNNNETPESKMENILREELGANHVAIEDISGGCGSMYKMVVVSEEFEGINKVKQHRLVQRALANEIADMHGLILDTKPASQFTATE